MCKGRPRLRNALADAYSLSYKRKLDPDREIVITSGANEGIELQVHFRSSLSLTLDRNALGILCIFGAWR